jgi:hypothetical protein
MRLPHRKISAYASLLDEHHRGGKTVGLLRRKGQNFMENSMLHKLLATAAWTAFALIVFFTISPVGMRPVVTANPDIERFAAFALIGLLFGLAYPRRLAVPASFVIFAAGALETYQLVLRDRHGHIAEVLVKAAGGAFGVAMASIILIVAERRKGPVNR